SAGFQLLTGLGNVAETYRWWRFFFPTAHFAVAWVAIGAIVVHVAVKLPMIRRALGAPVAGRPPRGRGGGGRRRGLGPPACGPTPARADRAAPPAAGGRSRGGPRRGPQGLPVNATAGAVGVRDTATDPGWVLEVVGRGRTARLTRDDLAGLPQRTARLPIA